MAGKPWYEKLRGVIDVKIDLRNFRLFHITVNNNQVATTDKRSQTVRLNLKRLTPKQREQLRARIKEAVLDEGYLLLEASAEKTVEEIKQLGTSERFRDLIERLSRYIPLTDIPILKAALFLREKHNARSLDVQKLKDDIVDRFGDRGRRIANLCTAGYFESMIIPLLDEMREAPDVEDEFRKSYDTIIAESGFAVFVPMAMPSEQIKSAVKARIRSNYRYGKKYLHIHGIGKLNIDKIRKCIDEFLREFPGLQKSIDKLIGTAVYIRLDFSEELGETLAKERGG